MASGVRILTLYSILSLAGLAILFVPFVHHAAEAKARYYSIYLLLSSFLVAAAVMPALISLGHRIGLVDSPNEKRKTHERATPLTGGIGIYIAFVAIMLLSFHFSVEVKVILVASTVIFLVGLADDIWGVSAFFRLLVQVAAVLLLVVYGIHVTFVPVYLGGIVTETIITMVWIIGITNSMNFIDGMDGLASGSSIIYTLFFSLIAILTKQYYLMFLALAITGSCAGFLPYNFRKGKPALVFLGDSGSTFLGFLLASFAILGEWGKSIVDIVIPVLIMSVLIFDMTLTTVVRILTGEVKTFGQWLHYTGRDHFHHRLADLGITNHQATWLLFGVSITFGIEALGISFASVLVSVLILLHSILVFTIIGIILVLKKGKKPANGL
jgi:UDP-GlcNAc:undecaprenyl-phosphate GlcNAc-1-phosphate transferase